MWKHLVKCWCNRLEVLEKSPGVMSTICNISLKVNKCDHYDGWQTTYLSGADLANVLRNLPASALDQIESMTNPSSKYEHQEIPAHQYQTKKNKARGSNEA